MARAAKTNGPADKEKKTAKKPAKKKQAVVVIHGMGEQRPMETLRSFVDTVWTKDLSLTAAQSDSPAEQEWQDNARTTDLRTGQTINKSWIVPDSRTGSFELSRITTPYNRIGVRTDFYELYWADIMQGTTWQHVWSWVKGLLFRRTRNVPIDVRLAWIVLWIVSFSATALLLAAVIPTEKWDGFVTEIRSSGSGILKWMVTNVWPLIFSLAALSAVMASLCYRTSRGSWFHFVAPLVIAFGLVLFAFPGFLDKWAFLLSIGAAVLGFVVHSLIVPTFGDVARYVQARPDTIEKRQNVRVRGLELLERVHKDYDRLIIVSHSLGTMVAYDLLQQLWSRYGPTKSFDPETGKTIPALPKRAKDALRAINEFARRAKDEELARQANQEEQETEWEHDELSEFQRHQFAAYQALSGSNKGNGWKVSDFVTLGSPLTHAEFLMSKNAETYKLLKAERRVSLCPPLLDEEFQSVLHGAGTGGEKLAHHAAVFSATRWTNISDKHTAVFFGDIISGPVHENFGPGITEYRVRIYRRILCNLWSRFFTHTSYWRWDPTFDDEADGVPEHIGALRSAVALDEN